MSTKHQILFLSHGGGPLPLLGDSAHDEMLNSLKSISSMLRKPSAILVISAHWEEKVPTITANAEPSIIYDYYGFPEEAYNIKYPCGGEPALAKKIHEKLNISGIDSDLDEERGFDHGLYVPLKIMYPEADIPCVQLSLKNNLSPIEHIRLGQALQDLDYGNLLIVGSGFTFHNLKAYFQRDTTETKMLNESFESWLLDTCSNKNFTEEERVKKLCEWEKAPGARFCQPREDHLLPLHVCYGVANSACTESYTLKINNKKTSMYFWQT
ncbi:DODA-type extradiol aromatic ring-opening family dioxygenase [Parashewanella tropica]|uniref:DODA-type extradiol aromatic ring-opening family dioxygenase n=1 Tax=Parashewanella tropica TaxID=2547970 RepID=UPI001059C61B|nr:class III extradiol ring-cleavage dioxygenase [Parashewanella tropica]